jgi:hypothetical protein
MKKQELKQLIKECITEIQTEKYIQNRKDLLRRGKEIINNIKEIGKSDL